MRIPVVCRIPVHPYRPAAVGLKFLFIEERWHPGAISPMGVRKHSYLNVFSLVFFRHPRAILR